MDKKEFMRQWGVDGMPADKIRLANAAWDCATKAEHDPVGAQDRLDAMLYRFLRDSAFDDKKMMLLNDANPAPTTPQEFNAAVYAAMLKDAQPKSELVIKLLELRNKYISAGGKLYTSDEINDEVRAGRG